MLEWTAQCTSLLRVFSGVLFQLNSGLIQFSRAQMMTALCMQIFKSAQIVLISQTPCEIKLSEHLIPTWGRKTPSETAALLFLFPERKVLARVLVELKPVNTSERIDT